MADWSPQRLAWAAGFFDGEGSIGIYERNQGRYSRLTSDISQRDPRPLLIFKEMFGGNIRKWDDRRGDNAVIWHWTISSRRAAIALETMLPYLILKRERAELALAYQKLMKYEKRNYGLTQEDLEARRIIRDEMRLLNRKGRIVSVDRLPVGG